MLVSDTGWHQRQGAFGSRELHQQNTRKQNIIQDQIWRGINVQTLPSLFEIHQSKAIFKKFWGCGRRKPWAHWKTWCGELACSDDRICPKPDARIGCLEAQSEFLSTYGLLWSNPGCVEARSFQPDLRLVIESVPGGKYDQVTLLQEVETAQKYLIINFDSMPALPRNLLCQQERSWLDEWSWYCTRLHAQEDLIDW